MPKSLLKISERNFSNSMHDDGVLASATCYDFVDVVNDTELVIYVKCSQLKNAKKENINGFYLLPRLPIGERLQLGGGRRSPGGGPKGARGFGISTGVALIS